MVEEMQSMTSLPVDNNDSLVLTTEALVKVSKVAVEIEGGRRRHSAPNEFVLRVKPEPGHSKRLLVLAQKSGGRRFISLVTENGEILRQYHRDYSGHGNPDDTVVSKSHKHYPTQKYPLGDSHRNIDTWAYDPGPFPEDFVEAVKHFCVECNITIEGLQERLPLRWFR